MPFLAFLGRWWRWLKNIISKGGDLAKDLLPKVIELVNNIKEFDVNNPDIADFLTKIIPGDWDDKLKEQARLLLPDLLKEFAAFDACLAQTGDEQLICITTQLQSVTNINIYSLNWGDLTALITHALSDKKLSVEEIRSLVKYVYDHMHHDETDDVEVEEGN